MKDPRRRWLLRKLDSYQPFDSREATMLARLIAFAMAQENCCDRRHPAGHITTAAWTVDKARQHALLVHHATLNKWLQPGGHVENDPSLIDAARRELEEETGLSRYRLLSGEIFDVDVHSIPARGNEAEHLHYDVRFIFEASSAARLRASVESHEVRWISLRELSRLNDSASMARLVSKTRQVRG